jgi:hypothetical protein
MKAKKIITIVVTVLASLMVVMSGIMKLARKEELVKALTEAGYANYISLLAAMELVFTALFIYPKTMKIGFVLLSCYFAGAIAVDLGQGKSILNPMMPMALVWIAAFLRDRSIFLPSSSK